MPGWAFSTTADLVIYYLTGSKTAYLIDPPKLRDILPTWVKQFPSRRVSTRSSNSHYETEGLLVPLFVLNNLFTKFTFPHSSWVSSTSTADRRALDEGLTELKNPTRFCSRPLNGQMLSKATVLKKNTQDSALMMKHSNTYLTLPTHWATILSDLFCPETRNTSLERCPNVYNRWLELCIAKTISNRLRVNQSTN